MRQSRLKPVANKINFDTTWPLSVQQLHTGWFSETHVNSHHFML